MEQLSAGARVLLSLALSFLAVTVAVSVLLFVLDQRRPSQPGGSIPSKAACSVWSDGVLTCNVHNPSDQVASIAATVEFDCSSKSSGKRDYASQPYRETVVVETVPEQGWSTTAISSDGFSRFYKHIQNELDKEAERIVKVAKEGGLAADDLTEEQRKYVGRTPLDVCKITAVSSRYTSAPQANVGAAIIATLKTLLKQ